MQSDAGTASGRPSILCFMHLPPNVDGHGGSQRAWYLTQALAALGDVHFVLLHPPGTGQEDVALDALQRLVRSVTLIPVREWATTSALYPSIPKRFSRWLDIARIRSVETPRLGRRALSDIVDRLPRTQVDCVFAGRLPTACIVDDLIRHALVRARRKVVDFDDILSRFRRRQLEAQGSGWSRMEHLFQRFEVSLLETEERRLARAWDAIGVCSDDDVDALSAGARAFVLKLPNIVEKPLLAAAASETKTILFVGNLNFEPNVHGLSLFVDEAWPEIRKAEPGARFLVVGMNPRAELRERLVAAGAEVHADVPSVEPFYRESDVVIAPILFGGGTRIKILEAMAYGRAVVSTTLGAEGLGLSSGTDFLAADTMDAFAGAVTRLLRDPALRDSISRNAREVQQRRFGKPALFRAVSMALGSEALPEPDPAAAADR